MPSCRRSPLPAVRALSRAAGRRRVGGRTARRGSQHDERERLVGREPHREHERDRRRLVRLGVPLEAQEGRRRDRQGADPDRAVAVAVGARPVLRRRYRGARHVDLGGARASRRRGGPRCRSVCRPRRRPRRSGAAGRPPPAGLRPTRPRPRALHVHARRRRPGRRPPCRSTSRGRPPPTSPRAWPVAAVTTPSIVRAAAPPSASSVSAYVRGTPREASPEPNDVPDTTERSGVRRWRYFVETVPSFTMSTAWRRDRQPDA